MKVQPAIQLKKMPPVATGSDPILGHLLKFRGNTYQFLEENCKALGPVFSFRLLSRNFYVLNHPDFIRHVLVTNAKNYSRKTSYAFLEEMLGQGLLTTEGELWKKRRRIAQPAFYKEQLERLLNQMEVSVQTCLSRLESRMTGPLDLYTEMNHIALTVLSNSIIQSDIENKIPLIEQSLMDALKYLSKKRFSALKWMTYLPGKTKTNGKKGIQTLKTIVREIVEARRQSDSSHADLLSMLMASTDEETNAKLSNEELVDEVMTIFIAGHDTTAVVLTWALYLIAHHPGIEEKMVREIEEKFNGESLSMADLRNFPFIKMVIQEVMRLYPPVWTFGRKALQDDEINGYHVPAGTYCTMPALFLHRNPEFWERPGEFYPEHFLPEKVKDRNKHAYFPFSAGQHLCIGEHYALIEVQLTLMYILKRYKIRLDSVAPAQTELLITLKPKDMISVRLEKRK